MICVNCDREEQTVPRREDCFPKPDCVGEPVWHAVENRKTKMTWKFGLDCTKYLDNACSLGLRPSESLLH